MEHEENLRDLAAMFAMVGLIQKNSDPFEVTKDAFIYADHYMDARKQNEEGIVAISKRRKTSD
jgi:hypothetical protein